MQVLRLLECVPPAEGLPDVQGDRRAAFARPERSAARNSRDWCRAVRACRQPLSWFFLEIFCV